MNDNELNELNRNWLRENSGLFFCEKDGFSDFCNYEETKKKILEMQNAISALEQQNRELNNKLITFMNQDTNVAIALQDCFGVKPVSCDGHILVPTEKYNELAELVNSLTQKDLTNEDN